MKTTNQLLKERVMLYNNATQSLTLTETVSLSTGISLEKLVEIDTIHALYSKMYDMNLTKLQQSKLQALKRFHILANQEININNFRVTSPRSIANVLIDSYLESPYYATRELVKLVCMDTKNNIKHIETLSMGTVNASLVSPREILMTSLRHKAVSVILSHSHPSGDTTPSSDDLTLTKQLQEVFKIVNDINFLDHLIIAPTTKSYTSLKEEGVF